MNALGAAVREEPYYSQACEVATETMRRVRRACELLVSRLGSAGYILGTYPDGSCYRDPPEPLVPPSKATRAEISQFEAQAGPLPISLVAFWEEVGSVNFIGMHPEWGGGLDPLVVYPADAVLSWLYDSHDSTDEKPADYKWFATLAPDDVHKDNESGGDSYGVALPDRSADFQFFNESHNLLFVPYLRLAILRFGGLPGLDWSKKEFKPLRKLVEGLRHF